MHSCILCWLEMLHLDECSHVGRNHKSFAHTFTWHAQTVREMWEGHKGQILRNKRHFILRNSWNEDSWALCVCRTEVWKLIRLSAVLLVQRLPSEVNHASQMLSVNTWRTVQWQSCTWEPQRFILKRERSYLGWHAGMHVISADLEKRHEQWRLYQCSMWYQVETW